MVELSNELKCIGTDGAAKQKRKSNQVSKKGKRCDHLSSLERTGSELKPGDTETAKERKVKRLEVLPKKGIMESRLYGSWKQRRLCSDRWILMRFCWYKCVG